MRVVMNNIIYLDYIGVCKSVYIPKVLSFILAATHCLKNSFF